MFEKNKTFLLLLFLLLVIFGAYLTSSTSAQVTEQAKSNEAILVEEFSESNLEMETVYMESFSQSLSKNPTAKGYIIIYRDKELPFGFQYCTDCTFRAKYSRSGKYLGVKPDIHLDSPKVIANILRSEKNYLTKRHNKPASRIVIINGGFRKWQEIELWLVPANSSAPKPQPTAFTRKCLK